MTHTDRLPDKWIVAIFEKFRLRYGSAWTNQTPEKDISAKAQEWSQILGNCTPDEIKYGLAAWDSEWPPNPYQFRTRCKAARRVGAYKPYEALPKPDGSRDKAKKGLAAAYISLAEPAPSRSDKEAYMEWTNKHRRMVRMPRVKDIDGSALHYVGDN